MTKRKTVQATPRGCPLEPSDEQITQALSDLMLDRPYYDARLVGSHIEFHTYGGQVLTWEVPATPPRRNLGAPQASASKPPPKSGDEVTALKPPPFGGGKVTALKPSPKGGGKVTALKPSPKGGGKVTANPGGKK